MSDARLILGDALAELAKLPDASVDAVVTDPPAGIKFMGVAWDTFRGKGGTCLRDPEAHFDKVGGNSHPRTGYDRAQIQRSEGRKFIACITPIFAECLRVLKPGAYGLVWALPRTSHWTATSLEDAGFEIRDRISHLFGQGFPKAKSCLKPACEDWWLVRKPDRHVKPLPGLDGCRIGTESTLRSQNEGPAWSGEFQGGKRINGSDQGRWPANVVLSHTDACRQVEVESWECAEDCPVRMLDEQSGVSTSVGGQSGHTAAYGGGYKREHYGDIKPGLGDTGGASRFFYVAKANRRDREAGNTHPTVKPIELMRWLCRLITPPGGTVLDCFMGSGSTGVAAIEEGFGFIGIERDPAYFEIAQRINAPAGPLFGGSELPCNPPPASPQ